jgi:acetylornithine deacetylase/succinyl-diaminopimelate desuccinylase-like protein
MLTAHLLLALLANPATAPASKASLASSPSAAECEPRAERYCLEVTRAAQSAKVVRAMQLIQRDATRARREMIELTEIPAPPFHEQARAARYLEMLREAGADSAWIDDAGNAIALRRGTKRNRRVLVEGHLDTVFPEGTDVKVMVRGDTLAAPGIGDDGRGLAGVLGVLRAISAAAIRTEADLLFAGTVGEEGLGDLRGVKYLFRPGAQAIDAYIALEPGGERLTVGGIGSHRYRVTFRGPGGHSWGAFGTASPIHALGRAISLFDRVGEIVTAEGPRASYNVGRIGGGTSVNAIAFEAWMEVDMRSEQDARLDTLDLALRESVHQAVREENDGATRGDSVTVELERVGDRPSGQADPADPLVLRASAVIRYFGGSPALGTGSTNSNIPFSLGRSAITIGAGGRSGDAHALTEWWSDPDANAYRALQRTLLLLVVEGRLAN